MLVFPFGLPLWYCDSQGTLSCMQEFMYFCKCLHELKGQQYLAESLKACGQIGAAIGVLSSVLNKVKKKIPGEDPWKSIYQKQIQDASEVLRKFVHENDFVWHEKIPSIYELPLPEGTKIVTFIPYSPKRWERQLSFKGLVQGKIEKCLVGDDKRERERGGKN